MSPIRVAAIMTCLCPAIAAMTLWAPRSGVISILLTMNVAVEMRNSAPTRTAVLLFWVASTGFCTGAGTWPPVLGLGAILDLHPLIGRGLRRGEDTVGLLFGPDA